MSSNQTHSPIPETEECQRMKMFQKYNKLKTWLAVMTSLMLATSSISLTIYFRILQNFLSDYEIILPALQIEKFNYIYYIAGLIITLVLFNICIFKASLSAFTSNPIFSNRSNSNTKFNLLGYFFLAIFFCLSLHSFLSEEQSILQQSEYIINLKNQTQTQSNPSAANDYLQTFFPNLNSYSNFYLFYKKVSFCHKLQPYITILLLIILMIQQLFATAIATLSSLIYEKRNLAGLEEILVQQFTQNC
ncbi:transmembrane protein, putative (macronuclear) [Tetrahymena thermophila SB210]|uniref:Transmembrane protein, putative n=1 Tax=Tetrahymena thermophila (strain SB210) TaxID=312017 RepID=I7M988_TETTS|nr:transmembrane protein, putative [Tetrahymena thermophila SB210]EAS01123.1 transmembrane protein, putative [Tetrahymena thermophila SB210]|eukprot:XP_001021368.1 transmembrane protein, putative [Tetrahymena thermophila SB210]